MKLLQCNDLDFLFKRNSHIIVCLSHPGYLRVLHPTGVPRVPRSCRWRNVATTTRYDRRADASDAPRRRSVWASPRFLGRAVVQKVCITLI